jgi:hypothetical protein
LFYLLQFVFPLRIDCLDDGDDDDDGEELNFVVKLS